MNVASRHSSGRQNPDHPRICCTARVLPRLADEDARRSLNLAVSIAFARREALKAEHLVLALDPILVQTVASRSGTRVDLDVLRQRAEEARPVLLLYVCSYVVEEALGVALSALPIDRRWDLEDILNALLTQPSEDVKKLLQG